MIVPLPLLVALVTLGGGGLLTWIAYVSKTLLEHARILAVVKYRLDGSSPVAFATLQPEDDRAMWLSHPSAILPAMKRAVLRVLTNIARRNPARALGAVAALITAVAGVLDQAGVQTWQAAAPVLLAEAIRRYVYCPETVDRIADQAIESTVTEVRRRVLPEG